MIPALILLLSVIGAGFAMRARSEAARRRRAETALEDQRREADSFAARVAPLLTHELRSQIATILGYQELLADGLLGKLEPEGLEALGRIRRAGRQILALTDGTGKLLAPRLEQPRLQPVDLLTALREAATDAAPLARAYGIDFELHEEGAPELLIAADREALRGALELVLGAIIKTSSGASPRLRVTAEPQHAILEIAPTGLDVRRDGPALAELPPRGGPATGAGLRLAMAAALLRPAGGRIALDAAENAPATIRLVLARSSSRIDGAPGVG